MEEKDLTQKQRKWLEESERIGFGKMTKTERLTLESLYNEMTPEEREQLTEYIQEKFGYEIDESPILAQQDKEYSEPSRALRGKLGAAARPKRDLTETDEGGED